MRRRELTQLAQLFLYMRLEKLPEVRAVIQTLSQPISFVLHVQQFYHATAWSQGRLSLSGGVAWGPIFSFLLIHFSPVFSLRLRSFTPNPNSLKLRTPQILTHKNTIPLLQLTSLMVSKMTNPLQQLV